jgi:cytochrome bd-type quinol oxidase subunit 2
MASQSDFSSAWQDYKRRRFWFYATWLGGMTVVFALGYPLTTLFHSGVPFYVRGLLDVGICCGERALGVVQVSAL